MNNDKLRNACAAAVQAFGKLKKDEFSELQSKLEFCIGSYDYDKNPVGLIEYGKKALEELKAYKSANPRRVNKKIINDLEKSLSN
jgi:hypothetical protein